MTKKRALEIKRRRRSSILNVDEESLIKNESGIISIWISLTELHIMVLDDFLCVKEEEDENSCYDGDSRRCIVIVDIKL